MSIAASRRQCLRDVILQIFRSVTGPVSSSNAATGGELIAIRIVRIYVLGASVSVKQELAGLGTIPIIDNLRCSGPPMDHVHGWTT